MRLVVDTIVFISAALKQASWPGMVLRWVDQYGGLLEAAATEREVLEVLERPRIAPKVSPVVVEICVACSRAPNCWRSSSM